jgi:NTE family protein
MRALVLGGGGIAGIAWETGILAGLGDQALEVDMVLGTSAGSAVGAVLTGGTSPQDAFDRQTAPADEPVADGDPSAGRRLMELFGSAQALSAEERIRRMGEISLATDTMSEDAWKARIGQGLPTAWPANLGVVAVRIDTGEAQIFTHDSGVDLLSAVAASCSVPGMFPAVTIGGKKYMDGGMRSTTNADLVSEYDEILVIAPFYDGRDLPNARVITPDAASIAAMTMNPLDPTSRIPSAHAGLAQGKALQSS